MVHFYFRAGKLVHIVGYRGDARAILANIRGWRRATLRFDPAVAVAKVILSDEYEEILSEVLVYLHLAREDILEGFAALIAICQHFCTPIVGEKDAHQLMLRALREQGPPLANLGVFRLNNLLFARDK